VPPPPLAGDTKFSGDFKALATVNMNITISSDVTPCGLVEMHYCVDTADTAVPFCSLFEGKCRKVKTTRITMAVTSHFVNRINKSSITNLKSAKRRKISLKRNLGPM
jgi:hypothetical protein